MEKDNFLFLRRLHGKMHMWRIRKQNQMALYKNIVFPLGKKVYVIGTPEHTNIGDSAIVLAELNFLVKSGFPKERIKEISFNEYQKEGKWIKNCISEKQLICWHGGGNLGDEWINEEYFRRNALIDFEKNPMIIFPQTIFYTDTEKGRREKQLSIRYYDGNKQLTIVAREKKSFEIVRELYPNTKSLLTPDIVLSTTKATFDVKKKQRTEVLLCLRNDAEKSLSNDECNAIEDILSKHVGSFRRIDMYSDIPITKENRKECVRKKMQEFAGAKLVITDRLHGMVFAAITGTPCIVFSNYNQKVAGTYEWIKDLSYIRYVDSVVEAENAIKDLVAIKEGDFDNSKWISSFGELEETINSFL